MSLNLEEILIKSKAINEKQLHEASDLQKKERRGLGYFLIKLGYLKEETFIETLKTHFGIAFVDLLNYEIEPEVLELVPGNICKKHILIPINRSGKTLTVAMADPADEWAVDEIKFITALKVDTVIAYENDIKESIERYYVSIEDDKTNEDLKSIIDLEFTPLESEIEEDEILVDEISESYEDEDMTPPTIKLVNLIIHKAASMGASDIHIEPFEKELGIRFRIAGILHEIMKIPQHFKKSIIARIKILSQLDIAERRIPQFGRIRLKVKNKSGFKELDLGVSTFPGIWGENITIRFLKKESIIFDLNKLGFEPNTLKKYEEAVSKSSGLVLVTGPTGSGKSITLHSSLIRLNKPEIKIITAESPVKFSLEGVNQLQVNEGIGLTFASALRTFLLHNPDIIMVGEIRDFETADIAIKTALSGCLILSTMHTGDAPSTITRLINMGCEPYLLADSLLLICAQRLIRTVCDYCKKEVKIPTQALVDIGFSHSEAPNLKIFKGKGCPKCFNTGYRGRIGLFEIMTITPSIKEMIFKRESTDMLKQKAIDEGMITLRESGLHKIREQITSIEEVLKET